MSSRSDWHGNEQDGIEFRWIDDDLDEICLYVGGKCVMHVERMGDNHFWMGLYTATHDGHCMFGSSTTRAAVKFYQAEGFTTEEVKI